MLKIKYDHASIKTKRKAVRESLWRESKNIKSGTMDCISPLDLHILYEHYDKIFFKSWFRDNFKGQILYELSPRMTKSAGKTKCPKNIGQMQPDEVKVIIAIGVDFFFKYNQLVGSKNVCGLETHNGLEALQIVFEHELIHVLEFLLFHTSSCNKQRFKETAKNIFGHSQSHHHIPTNLTLAREKYGINIGDKVQFVFKDKPLTGLLVNVTKRATVMVENLAGEYVDKNGTKYEKYYVPLERLAKAR
ncbi:MAG: hypothetical protein GX349_01935 [Firmicutes bacterium]|nr:hypothetical protein [Bacillota bacterium]